VASGSLVPDETAAASLAPDETVVVAEEEESPREPMAPAPAACWEEAEEEESREPMAPAPAACWEEAEAEEAEVAEVVLKGSMVQSSRREPAAWGSAWSLSSRPEMSSRRRWAFLNPVLPRR